MAVVLLACVVGLHWALLQVFAWTGMVLRYSSDYGIREAIVRTFDGHHPCALCLAVKAGRAAERDREAVVSSARWEAVVPASEVVLIFIADGFTPSGREVDGSPRFYPPPKPRPRLAA